MILFKKSLLASIQKKKKIKKKIPIAIFGTGKFAFDLKNALVSLGYNFKYFVDKKNYLKKLKIHENLKLSEQQLDNYTNNIQLIVGVNNREVPIGKLITRFYVNSFIDIFLPQDIFHIVENKLGWRYWLSSTDYLLSDVNFKKLKKAISFLSDDLSKERLVSIYKYRLGLMPEYSNFIDEEQQYFNPISIPKKNDIIYCDIGAFDGDTIKSAVKHLSISEIYAFEPVSGSFKSLLKENKLKHIKYIILPLGVSNQYKKIPFSNSDLSTESARIAENGNDFINAISIDESFNVNFNFIKIDVEGFEKDVILGAKKTIQKAKPIIAMSLYHNPFDLWELPILIKKILPEYKLYVRQHGYNTFECVLYCIPK